MKRLAFLILAHNDPVHLCKLVKALDFNADFYIHIDKQSEIKEFQDVLHSNNVTFIKNRFSVYWAGFSMVNAMMSMVHEALKNAEAYSHAVFITGSCYPIKNSRTIYDHITSNPQKEFINFIDMRDSPEHYLKLVKQKWFKDHLFKSSNKYLILLDKCIRFLLNKLKLKNHWDEKIIPYTGHTWCAITMNCCKYVYDFHIKNPWFREMNRFTFAVDEHYIHTIIGNSHFKHASLGVSEYKGRGLYQYTSFYLIDNSLSKWYDINDWQEIVKSDKLFVRKVNSKTGSELVAKLNSEG